MPRQKHANLQFQRSKPVNLETEALLAYSPRERDSNQEEWHATSQANGGFY